MAAIPLKRRLLRNMTPILAILFLITLLPILIVGGLAMSLWLSRQPLQWERLGQVGESYGGLSAVLSGIALIAITASLLMQSRQMKASIIQATRQCHFELTKMAIENPRIPKAMWGYASETDAQVALAANLHLVYWAMLADLDSADHDAIRRSAADFFKVPTVRKWWAGAGESYALASSPRVRIVAAIVNEEYDRARADIANNADRGEPARVANLLGRTWSLKTAAGATAVAAVACAVSIWSLARKRMVSRQEFVSPSRKPRALGRR